MEHKSGLQWYADAFKQFATFKGRSRRKAYWYFVLFHIIIVYSLAGLIGIVQSGMALIPLVIYVFAAMIPGLALGVRRMHDAGKSGWFLLVPIYSLILAVSDSEPGTNKWGPNPKNPELDETDHLLV